MLMLLFLKLIRLVFVGFFGMSVVTGIVALGTYLYFAPGLPSVGTLKDVELQVPLKVYSRNGKLIAVYGEKRRQPLNIDEVPDLFIKAFLSAEDDRFFEHPGVDYQGLIRAAIELLVTGEKRQGGSTITMQLARNFFLGNERTYVRKLREIFLALRIEHIFTKNEILELYLNKIYLGNRAYGVGAAADVYYGLDVSELNVAQIAMIAGLPKAPSAYNPVADPERAILRRDYVLGRMFDLRFIDEETYQFAINEPVTASRHYPRVEVNAPYVGEMARAYMINTYGTEAYNNGYHVYTTIDSNYQRYANKALIKGLLEYDKRHGYRGPESRFDILLTGSGDIDFISLDKALKGTNIIGGLLPAVITNVESDALEVYLGAGQSTKLNLDQAKWARPYVNENVIGNKPKDFTKIFSIGDVVRVIESEDGVWALSQIPNVSGALVVLDPQNGGILALEGGFDYNYSKFNRVTQAKRQPGSSFKPFIYSAALDLGYTPASIVNDAPVVFEDVSLEDTWRPKNYGGKFSGPIRLRVALFKSRNMVSIRLLKDIGRRHALEHITKFGFDQEKLPYNLTLALGSGVVTPLELARGYSVFANGGYSINPFLIEKIENAHGEIIFNSNPDMVCEQDCQDLQKQMQLDSFEVMDEDESSESEIYAAKRVISEENAYQMTSMMKDVIQRGTGKKARELGRTDLAGKTGTTNDQHDAWFSGFNSDIVATAWVGFDQHKPLGRREVGGVAALPIWIDFMRNALEGKQEHTLVQPEGIVTMRINPTTGLLVDQDSNYGIEETFREEYIPDISLESNSQQLSPFDIDETKEIDVPEQLF